MQSRLNKWKASSVVTPAEPDPAQGGTGVWKCWKGPDSRFRENERDGMPRAFLRDHPLWGGTKEGCRCRSLIIIDRSTTYSLYFIPKALAFVERN